MEQGLRARGRMRNGPIITCAPASETRVTNRGIDTSSTPCRDSYGDEITNERARGSTDKPAIPPFENPFILNHHFVGKEVTEDGKVHPERCW